MYERLVQLLLHEKHNRYDYYIFSRMDIELVQPIYLNQFNKKFSMITRGPQLGGGGLFYNRDWDYMWVGCEKGFNLWCINTLEFGRVIRANTRSKVNYDALLNGNSFIYDMVKKYKNIGVRYMKQNYSKYGITGDLRPITKEQVYRYDYVELFHTLILLLENQGLTFEIGKNYSKLIR